MQNQKQIEADCLLAIISDYDRVADYIQDADINGDDFLTPSHRWCWSCICELIADGAPVDIASVRAKYILNNTISPQTFDDILDGYAIPEHAVYYFKCLKDATKKRAVQRLGRRLAGSDCDGNADDLIAATIAELSDMDGIANIEKSRIAKFTDYAPLIEEYVNDPLKSAGLTTGWKRLDNHWKHRHGNLVIVTGIPSAGKSEVMDQIMVNSIRDLGWKWAVFSPENYPLENHFQKLCEKLVGLPMFAKYGRAPMTREQRVAAMRKLSEHMSIITPEESGMSLDRLLNRVRVIQRRYGCDGCIIDPYNELEHKRSSKMSETEYISEFLSKLRNFGRLHNIEMTLVAHPTKMVPLDNGDYRVPTMYDISGCHSSDTEVLTIAGWKKHSDVTLKDEVCCFNPETSVLQYDKPSKVWKHNVIDEEMYHFKCPSFDGLVTGNHRMYVKPYWAKHHTPIGTGLGRPFKYDRDKWNVVKAEDLKSDLLLPFATPLKDDMHECSDFMGFDAIDFAMFLGWWIAEGSIIKKSGGIAISQAVGDIADRIKQTMTRMGIVYSENIGKPGGKGGKKPGWSAYIGVKANRQLVTFIRNNCGDLSKTRTIPQVMFSMPMHIKEALLEALIDGDGSRSKTRDTCKYSTTSKTLADDIQRLAIETGRMAVIRTRQPKAKGHNIQYELNIGRKGRREITWNYKRNLEKIKYTGNVYCLTVPTGAYLTRRNGKPFVSGNSANFRNKADVGISIWRSYQKNDGLTEVHITKVRDKNIGSLGKVVLKWDYITGCYTLADCPDIKA